MRNVLVAALMLTAATPALASSISVTIKEDAVVVGTVNSPDGNLNVNSQTFGTFNLNTLSINDADFLVPGGVLDTNALDVQQTSQVAGHTFELLITANGLVGPGALTNLLSDFSVTGLTAGWTIQEKTLINGVLLSQTAVFSGNNASGDIIAAALLTNPYSATADYIITTKPGTGEFNGGVDIQAAATPLPAVGIPGMIAGLLGLWGLSRRKRTAEVG
jgi:hypothetical protein